MEPRVIEADISVTDGIKVVATVPAVPVASACVSWGAISKEVVQSTAGAGGEDEVGSATGMSAMLESPRTTPTSAALATVSSPESKASRVAMLRR